MSLAKALLRIIIITLKLICEHKHRMFYYDTPRSRVICNNKKTLGKVKRKVKLNKTDYSSKVIDINMNKPEIGDALDVRSMTGFC